MDLDACEVIYQRSKALLENGMAGAALELLNFRLAEEPNQPLLLELKGTIHHALGEFELGRAALETAGLMRPLSVKAQLALADCYCFTQRQDLARVMYRKLASRDDLPCEVLSSLAMGLGRLSDFDGALEVCRVGAERNPNCHHARYGFAYYMSKLKYPPELIYPVLHRIVEMVPGIFTYRMAASTILCQMGQLDRAYLTIADATADELNSISCRCCLERLIFLYKSASDENRVAICARRQETAGSEC